MSKRRDLEAHLRSLNEIKEIMNAMKNLSLMEVHRLTRFLDTQRKVIAAIEAAATDFRLFHPELFPGEEIVLTVHVLIGTERGFCGDFNESLLRRLEYPTGLKGEPKLVVVGSKLAAKLSEDTRVAAFLNGASVVEEVDSVLVKLMETLTGLGAGAAGAPLRLIVIHHDPAEEGVKVSELRPFRKADSANVRFADPPMLYLQPQSFLAGLAEQYLFAALHELLYSSLLAENQRRMQHMEAAVQRLDRRSAELWQKRNVLRQEEITEEIEVIMLSVEALE